VRNGTLKFSVFIIFKELNCLPETVALYKAQVRTEHDANAIELGLGILRYLFDMKQYDQLVTMMAELATVRSTKMKVRRTPDFFFFEHQFFL